MAIFPVFMSKNFMALQEFYNTLKILYNFFSSLVVDRKREVPSPNEWGMAVEFQGWSENCSLKTHGLMIDSFFVVAESAKMVRMGA